MQQNPGEIAFEGSDAKDFKKFCFSLCQLHRELGEHFNQEFFPDLPKMHHLMHCCLQCDVLSPKMTWGYKGRGCEGIAREMLCLTIETAAGGREGGGVGRVVAGYVRDMSALCSRKIAMAATEKRSLFFLVAHCFAFELM